MQNNFMMNSAVKMSSADLANRSKSHYHGVSQHFDMQGLHGTAISQRRPTDQQHVSGNFGGGFSNQKRLGTLEATSAQNLLDQASSRDKSGTQDADDDEGAFFGIGQREQEINYSNMTPPEPAGGSNALS